MRAALCAAAIALLSTSLAAALAPQTARADVIIPFRVSGTALASPLVGNHCGDDCVVFGTLTINDVAHEWLKRFAAAVERDSQGRIKSEIFGPHHTAPDAPAQEATDTPADSPEDSAAQD